MSLFSITRYGNETTVDNGAAETAAQESRASAILKKLHLSAEKRKQARLSSSHDLPTTIDDNKKSSKSNDLEIKIDVDKDEHSDATKHKSENIKKSTPSQKIKRRKSDGLAVSQLESPQSEINNSDKSRTPKKRKFIDDDAVGSEQKESIESTVEEAEAKGNKRRKSDARIRQRMNASLKRTTTSSDIKRGKKKIVEKELEKHEDSSNEGEGKDQSDKESENDSSSESESESEIVVSKSADESKFNRSEEIDESNRYDNEDLSDDKHLEFGSNGNDLGPEIDENVRVQDVGGFTLLGQVQEKRLEKLQYKLPDWLAHPTVMVSDLRLDRLPIDHVTYLDVDILNTLRESGIHDLFPVQQHLIPAILRGCQPSFTCGIMGWRPRDLCCSSPTGSGKTLAFALPIVQALKSRVVPRVRALIVLPVRDLAKQVHKVFQSLCKHTPLKVGLMVGQKTFSLEQSTLVKKDEYATRSLVDIVVATPGRLVDHIQKTDGFELGHLRFLVIDEADRILDEIKQDWLHHVTQAINNHYGYNIFTQPLTVANAAKLIIPPQKLLFSATLTQNPEKLQQLDLFQPKLYTSIVAQTGKTKKKLSNESDEQVSKQDNAEDTGGVGDFIGKYTTPTGLTEYFMECTPQQRPLLVLHALHNLKFRQILCFTNSLESTHRLASLVGLFGRDIEVREFSSNLDAGRRAKIIKQFQEGKVHMIVCSDAMARGMDIDNVKYIISYEPPLKIKTYIHRVGRTARAGRAGLALSLLEKREIYDFKKMLKAAGKSDFEEQKVRPNVFKNLMAEYTRALEQLPQILKKEKLKKSSKKR